MVRKCCIVDGCYSNSDTSPAISFHSIPKAPEILEEWKKVLTISRRCGFVCSEHFKSESFHSKGPSSWVLNKKALPVKAIPDRWMGMKRVEKNKNEEEPELVPRRRYKKEIEHWKSIARDRQRIDERLQKRKKRKSQEDINKKPWWLKRDLPKEDEKQAFWDNVNSDVWNRPWRDEVDASQKKQLQTEKLPHSNDEDYGDLIQMHGVMNGPSNDSGFKSCFLRHPGANDNVQVVETVNESGCDEIYDKNDSDYEEPVKEVSIESIQFECLVAPNKHIIQPVISFNKRYESMLYRRAHHYFPELFQNIIPPNFPKTKVLDIAKRLGERYVNGTLVCHKKMSYRNTGLTPRKKFISIFKGNNSLKIKLQRLVVPQLRYKNSERLRIRTEYLKYRRQERALLRAIDKTKQKLKNIKSKI